MIQNNTYDNEYIIKEISTYKNLRTNTIRRYQTVLNQYSTVNNKSIQQLLTIAEEEQQKNILPRKRSIKKHILAYINYLKNNKKTNTTIKANISVVKALYNFYDIQLPKLPTFKKENHETINDILTREQIIQAIESTNNILTKAIIIFMATSGTAKNEALHITINDFIQATSEYHHASDISEVIFSLEKRNDVVPTFTITRIKTNKSYYAFCTPEANKYIIKMLKERLLSEPINNNDKLFNISGSALNQRFIYINKKCGFNWKNTRRLFHSHALRKYFRTTLFNNDFDFTTAEFMLGHKISPVLEAYIKVNPNKQKKKYMQVMNKLTFFEEFNIVNLTNKEKEELEYLKKYKSESEERIKELERIVNIILED